MSYIANRRMEKRILDDINDERVFQYQKWGPQDHDDFKWLAIVTEELGEAAQEALEVDFLRKIDDENRLAERKEMLRKELIQVAASTIAFIEAIDRRS